MDSTVVVFATITAKEGCADKLLAVLTRLTEQSQAEAGCTSYILHRDNDDEKVFVIYEIWKSSSDLEAHNNTEHFKEAFSQMKEITEPMSANVTSVVPT